MPTLFHAQNQVASIVFNCKIIKMAWEDKHFDRTYVQIQFDPAENDKMNKKWQQ